MTRCNRCNGNGSLVNVYETADGPVCLCVGCYNTLVSEALRRFKESLTRKASR